MAISMLKIRRPLGRLIFNMGIAIPGKTVFLIETAPRFFVYIRFRNIISQLKNTYNSYCNNYGTVPSQDANLSRKELAIYIQQHEDKLSVFFSWQTWYWYYHITPVSTNTSTTVVFTYIQKNACNIQTFCSVVLWLWNSMSMGFV